MRVRVPAKVNLRLDVGARRPDGYHELTTVFQAIDLYDEVTASPGSGLKLTLRGPESGDVPTDSRNLAWRAAQLLAEHTGQRADAHLEIAKAIPVAAGLAGGSADAAATLVACAQLWQTRTQREELIELAAQLGSDVAFGLLGGTALGTGRGESLAPLLSTGTTWWTFAFADFGLSTPSVYAELDRRRGGPEPKSSPHADAESMTAVIDAVRAGDAVALAQGLGNDLQDCALALQPSLRRTLDAGRALGALAGIICGSGPTCAFLAADRESALGLAAALATEGVCRSTRVACGPVPGARVVR